MFTPRKGRERGEQGTGGVGVGRGVAVMVVTAVVGAVVGVGVGVRYQQSCRVGHRRSRL